MPIGTTMDADRRPAQATPAPAVGFVAVFEQALARSSIEPDRRFGRRDIARVLTENGFKISEATLATKATRGGGPPYQLFGKVAIYEWGPSLSWALSLLTAPRRSTSEATKQAA